MSSERENDSIIQWRYEQLLAAGYDCVSAVELAYQPIDLHKACELLTQSNCTPQLAVRILN